MVIASPSKDISILLPAYNEAERIEDSIKAVENAVKTLSSSYEIIVAEDGSADQTAAIALRLAKANPNVELLHSSARLGKGGAIKRALGTAKGTVIVFMDVDLSTGLNCLQPLVQSVKNNNGLAIGSRHIHGAKVQRPPSRALSSFVYNFFVNLLFLDGVYDHQCGFKAMSYEVAKIMSEQVKSDSWFFDTELILRCRKLGYPLTELGVEWSQKEKKEKSKIRLSRDSPRMGLDLLRYRLNGNRPDNN
jgi:glycosyltransferase involved in cell wall biosynthesis